MHKVVLKKKHIQIFKINIKVTFDINCQLLYYHYKNFLGTRKHSIKISSI